MPGEEPIKAARRYNEANAAKVFIANLSLSEVPYPFLSQAVQSAEEAIYSLQPFTNASAALRHAFEVAEAVKLLEITLSYSYNKEVVAAQMLTVIDELLDLPIQVLFESNSSERILAVLDRFMSNVHWLSRNITVTKRNFALEVRTVTWIEHDKGTYYSPK
ncbi:hypothetical protein LSH36_103g06066, partial [Paralvinella palmiformis]